MLLGLGRLVGAGSKTLSGAPFRHSCATWWEPLPCEVAEVSTSSPLVRVERSATMSGLVRRRPQGLWLADSTGFARLSPLWTQPVAADSGHFQEIFKPGEGPPWGYVADVAARCRVIRRDLLWSPRLNWPRCGTLVRCVWSPPGSAPSGDAPGL